MLELPSGIRPTHDIRPPNKPLRLYSGIFELDQQACIRVRGRIELAWHPFPQVRFVGVPAAGSSCDLGPAVIRVPSHQARACAQVHRVSWGARPQVAGIVDDFLRLGPNRPICELRFLVPNFHHYIGQLVQFQTPERVWRSRSRLVLGADGWRIELDQEPEFSVRRELVATDGGYGVGHAGRIVRDDGAPFRLSDVSDVWSSLHFFLSFLRGLWCGPIAATGVGRRAPLFTEWGSWRIVPWTHVGSWFPAHDTDALNRAFLGFRRLWNQSSWNEPLRELVHWYVEANLHAGALEGALVLGHTALDLLAWMLLVVERRTFSARRFEQIPAAEQISMALDALGVPVAFPAELAELAAFARVNAVANGPGAISKLRNTLVHPSPTNRRFLATATASIRIQALTLCLWYVELGLLSLLGYRGKYVSRLASNVTVGEATMAVPWT